MTTDPAQPERGGPTPDAPDAPADPAASRRDVGDREAYAADVRRITDCQRALFGYILSLTGDAHEAEEALAETNLVLWRRLPEFEGRSTFTTWACGVAYRTTLSMRRRRRSRSALPLDESVMSSLAALAAERAGDSDRRVAALRRCVGQLPEANRKLLSRRYDAEDSIERIARDMNRSERGLRVTLHRIRRALAECIDRTLEAEGGAA